MNENQAQNQAQQNQATNQTNQKNQAAAKYAEAKTVVNGQEVSVQQAQAAEEAFNKQNNQTGVQAHHDNSSEAVQAGQTAQNTSAQKMQQQKTAGVKTVDVQSGQQHLEQHMQSGAQSQAQMNAQETQETIQNSLDAKAKAKAKKGE